MARTRRREPAALADMGQDLIIKEGNLFLVTDSEGNVPLGRGNGHGLYCNDTRYLSGYNLSFDGIKPIVLYSTAELGHSMEQVLTNPSLNSGNGHAIPKETIVVKRSREVNGRLEETIQLTNFHIHSVTVTLRLDFEADFRDIFEVRGLTRQRRGVFSPAQATQQGLTFGYQGLDDIRREATIRFSTTPDHIQDNSASFSIFLRPQESKTLDVAIQLYASPKGSRRTVTANKPLNGDCTWFNNCTQISTDNEIFNRVIERSLGDLRLLLSGRPGEPYLAAGTPWFNALFGRDSLITAFQTLAFNPEIAKDTLRLLARYQGSKVDPWRDEEPGKILHELRVGEMANLNEVPFAPYYGAVDSTPLFLMLVSAYYAWTGDLSLMRQLEPNIRSALHWIDHYGDEDGDGYVEYSKYSKRGLVNQGWKDSGDAIIDPQGLLAKPPIALVEAQGYVYAAKKGLAWVFAELGDQKLSQDLSKQAAILKASFNKDFWLEDEAFCALALAEGKKPLATITSNPGQALWTGIIDKEKAPFVIQRLLQDDLFSGWGIRTLSSKMLRYNPLAYHLGSVWSHDNSLIGVGFKRYGYNEELNKVATALYDCCGRFNYYRLPELFSGAHRHHHHLPVPYPGACRPQAWAAGAPLLLLQGILGLVPNAPVGELKIVSPRLPPWLSEVRIQGLRVGKEALNLLYRRSNEHTSVLAQGTLGKTRVSILDQWPN
ncbi:MAG: amylo-alpha-1,6-glucosidase [Chloroflexi bacterium]|nr:amylo-alpha-1,6-glucosidase [Chloroflexota bacterium]